jgi:hypothetical protein
MIMSIQVVYCKPTSSIYISPTTSKFTPYWEINDKVGEVDHKDRTNTQVGSEREMCLWAISISVLVIKCPTHIN